MGYPCSDATSNERARRKYPNNNNDGTRWTKIIVHGAPADICEAPMGAFFSKYGPIEEVFSIISKSGIAKCDMVLHVKLTREVFGEIQNVLMLQERWMLVVVVEGRRTYYWSCGAMEHMAKAFQTSR